jgi:hypothetical protein
MDEMARMPPAWVDFLIMTGALLLVAVVCLLWLIFLRKPGRRRKPRHHHRRRSHPVTLAHTGGLPPVHREDPPSGPPASTSQP